jgi:hypothetical protein
MWKIFRNGVIFFRKISESAILVNFSNFCTASAKIRVQFQHVPTADFRPGSCLGMWNPAPVKIQKSCYKQKKNLRCENVPD